MRPVGPQKMGTSLAGNMAAELVVLLRDIPSGKYGSCFTCILYMLFNHTKIESMIL